MHSKHHKKIHESNPGWILLPDQMDILKRSTYAYNASTGSFLELLFLQRFWIWLSKYIPKTIAPCVLTCLGLAINLFCCLTVLYYTPDVKTDAPPWTFVLCAIGVFLYQTLDALDGKQAIKVQNTQIEEVYDHGCDAISTVFVFLTTAAAFHLSDSPAFVLLFFLFAVNAFYTTHWQDHVTHAMIFGRFDVSEAQFSVMVIHLITAYFGQHFWQTQVLFTIELRHLICIASFIVLARSILININYICGSRTPLDDYIKLSRKQGPHIWNPLIPVSILTLFAVRAFNAGLLDLSPCIFIVAFGFAFAKVTMKLVIANVTSADMDVWDSSLIVPMLLCLNTYIPVIPAYTALLCVFVCNLMDLARYFTYVSWDMREALDTWIFTIKYNPGHPKCKNGNCGFYLNGLNNEKMREELNQKNGHITYYK